MREALLTLGLVTVGGFACVAGGCEALGITAAVGAVGETAVAAVGAVGGFAADAWAGFTATGLFGLCIVACNAAANVTVAAASAATGNPIVDPIVGAGGGAAAVAPESTLYRAVSSAERADIASFGGFRQALSGQSYEGKLFALTAEDAARFGRINYGMDQQAFHIVAAQGPVSLVESLYSGIADGMRFVAVDPERLAEFNRLVRISIWEQVPWVVKP